MRLRRQYDVLLVLGNGFTNDWKLHGYMENRMGRVADLYKKGVAKRVGISGKWSLSYDRRGIVPPVNETDEIEKRLEAKGIPKKALLKEGEEAKDLLGNAYFFKTRVARPMRIKSLLVVCSDFQIERATFLFKKVFGPDYEVAMLGAKTPYTNDPEAIASQKSLLEQQKQYLSGMRDGDDSFLEGKLYRDPDYPVNEQAAFFAMGRRL